jgi:serine/threonine protein kinase
MAWSFRAVVGKWKPAARCLVGCLLKAAGGAAAAADPANEMLYMCLTAAGEQGAEHLFDALPDADKRKVEDRFALLKPLLEQNAELISRLQGLADQQALQTQSTEELTVLIQERLPAELKPSLDRFHEGLSGTMAWLIKFESRVMRRMDELERRPKSPFWVTINDQEDVDWLRQLYEESRGWPEEKRRQLRLGQFAGLLHHAGQYEEASAVCAEAAAATTDADEGAELLLKKMRSDLERRRLDDALTDLRQAVALRPASAPYPARKYDPVGVLGAGGFGVALLCRNLHEEGNQVVVKCLNTDGLDRKPSEIFTEVTRLRELHAAHPDLFINVYYGDFADPENKKNPRPYLVMEYFPGVTLTNWLETQVPPHEQLPLADFQAVARSVACAIHSAHQRGILHRDLKPDNILIRKGDKGWDTRVIDFGLALRHEVVKQSVSQKAYSRALLGAAAAGTAKYAPPEQMGELDDKVDKYSDVFAFGKTCCWLLFRNLEPGYDEWNSLPRDLAQMLDKCLKKQPKNRYQDFTSILAALDSTPASIHIEPLQPLTLTAGSATMLVVRVARQNYNGALNVSIEGLPPTLTARPSPIPPGGAESSVHLNATTDAAPGQTNVQVVVRGTGVVDQATLTVRVVQQQAPPPVQSGGIWPALNRCELPNDRGRYLVYLAGKDGQSGQWYNFVWGPDPGAFCLLDANAREQRQNDLKVQPVQIWQRALGRIDCNRERGLFINKEDLAFWKGELRRLNLLARDARLIRARLNSQLRVHLGLGTLHPQDEEDATDPVISVTSGTVAFEDATPDLLIDVRNTRLTYKRPRDYSQDEANYASAGVRELWVLDVLNRQMQVCRAPDPFDGYSERRSFTEQDSIAALIAPDCIFQVAALLAGRP